jgi:phosphatidylinositol alpha-1,6-mannosyltransferase
MTWHLVTTDFPPRGGGVATWAYGVAAALHAAGEPVLVHARDTTGAEPFPVVRMVGRSWARWGGWWAAASVIPRLRRGDRVVSATWPTATHLIGATRRIGVPLLVGWHGSDLTRRPLVAGIEAVKAAGIHIPVSAYLADLLGVPATVLPCPVDVEPPAVRGERLLVVARLGPLKGVDRALRLAARLGRPITVVGEGAAREALEALAQDLRIESTFTGDLPRASIPWEGTWALVLLSRPDDRQEPPGWQPPPGGAGQEGLGLVLLEAAARGIPSIGVRTGGIPEAASVILEDPERDPVPTLPGTEAVQAWLRARHGSARTVEALRAVVAESRKGADLSS